MAPAISSAAPPIPASSTPATKAETQALLDLIKNKPPANLDGLLSFINDLRREQPAAAYTDREMKAMLACPSGQVLADAIRKCEGLRRQVKKHVDDGRKQVAVSPGDSQFGEPDRVRTSKLEQQRANLQQATFKYLDCLSYHVCPDRWGSYTSCWTSLGRLSSADVSALLEIGGGAGWELLCQKERKDLERCVGSHVTTVVRQAVILQIYDDELEDVARS